MNKIKKTGRPAIGKNKINLTLDDQTYESIKSLAKSREWSISHAVRWVCQQHKTDLML